MGKLFPWRLTMMTLTEPAQGKISELLVNLPTGGVRVGTVMGGCAGMRYTLALETAPKADDAVVTAGGASVFIDPESALNLEGTVMDFVAASGGGGFTFDNPNAVGRCSCSDPNANCASSSRG